VHDGVTGLLVEPEDEEGFAATLERVLLDDGLRSDLGQKGIEHARAQFALDRLVDNVDALYRRLLDAPQFGPAPKAPLPRRASESRAEEAG
jgi:D-inositol-3-phosphate glycosyltransferase